ncbi:unnamed protein product, partial [Allacma fusca]
SNFKLRRREILEANYCDS